MYTIKIFSNEDPSLLEEGVNQWLAANKDILIHSSNMLRGRSEPGHTDVFYFHVLYAAHDTAQQELKEMAAAVTQEQSIELKEINPEILKPSS